jgi:hypothetical protein
MVYFMTAPSDTLEMENLFLKLSEMEAQWQGLQTNDGPAESAAASPAVQAQTARLQKMIQQEALYSARIKWVPPPFYTHWTASERAHYLETNAPSAVCRSLVLENRKQALDKDPSHPRFILVVWPTVADLDVNKVTKAVQALRRDPQLPCTAFDWQVALPADTLRLTGCPFSNVVSPLCATDSNCHLAVFLSKTVVPHRFFWMDTGIWTSKVGLTVSDFTKAVKPYICDLSAPKATRAADLKAAPLDAIPLAVARTDLDLEAERQTQVSRLPTVDNPQYRPLQRTQLMKVAMKTTASVRRKQEARKLQVKREDEARHVAAAKAVRKASLPPSSRLLQPTASSARRVPKEEETAVVDTKTAPPAPVTRKPTLPNRAPSEKQKKYCGRRDLTDVGTPPPPRRLVRRDTPALPVQTVSKVAGKIEVVHATPRRSQPVQPKAKVVTPSSSTRRGGRRGLAAGMEPIVEQHRIEAFVDDSTDGGFSSGDDMMLGGLLSDDDDIGALLGDDEEDTEDYEDTNTSGDMDDDLLGDSSHPKPVTERVVNGTVTRVRRELARDFTRRVPHRTVSSAEHPELDPEVLEEGVGRERARDFTRRVPHHTVSSAEHPELDPEVLEETTHAAVDEPVFLRESSHLERTATDPLQDSTTISIGEDSSRRVLSVEDSSQEESTVEELTLGSTTGEAVNPGPILGTRVGRERARFFTRRVPHHTVSSAEHPELDPEVLEETTHVAVDEPVFLRESLHPEQTATDPLQDSTTEAEDSSRRVLSVEDSSQEESTVEGSTLGSTTGEAGNPGPILESPAPEPAVEIPPAEAPVEESVLAPFEGAVDVPVEQPAVSEQTEASAIVEAPLVDEVKQNGAGDKAKELNSTVDTETSFESIDGTMEGDKEELQQDVQNSAAETAPAETETSNGKTNERVNGVETERETPIASNKSSVASFLGPEVANLKEFDKDKLAAIMGRRREMEDGSIAPMAENVEADESKLEGLKNVQMSSDLQAIMERRRQATDQKATADK